MILLALESSAARASVSVQSEGQVIQTADVPPRQTAKSLIPTIADALRSAGLTVQDVGVIAVVVGPGSFTGLRIGVTTAKTLAYVTRAQLFAANSLDVVAYQAADTVGLIECIMDAHRGQLFAASYRSDGKGQLPVNVVATRILSIEEWMVQLPAGAVVTGPATRLVGAHQDWKSCTATVRDLGHPSAESLGKWAWHLIQQQHAFADPWQLEPNYYRPSAAEEKASRQR